MINKPVTIRSISRCVAVLRAINAHGSLSIMEIVRTAHVPYPTASRIVQTLIHEGYVEREPNRKHYRPTALVQSLSTGFQAHDRLVKASRPHIVDLTQRLKWPVSVVTRVGRSMVVRDSTHPLTSMTFTNYYPGHSLPILESASGRAYLAYAPEDERQAVIEGERRIPGGGASLQDVSLFERDTVLRQIREDGYATRGRSMQHTPPGRTSSLAVPLFDGDRVTGALTLIFFASALRLSEACAKYAGELKETAARITADLDQQAA